MAIITPSLWRYFLIIGLVAFSWKFGVKNVVAQETPPTFSDGDLEFFEKEVRPILVDHCFECHGVDEQEAALRLDSRQTIIQGGDTGPAIVPGHPEQSLLVEVINYDGTYQMPPDSKLPQAQIDVLKKWIEMGAPWPTESALSSESAGEDFDLLARRQAHWCWQSIRVTSPPTVRTKSWVRDPVDSFIMSELEKAGLTVAADADRATLIRRVTFDLIGLPPTPDEIDAFVKDTAPNAYEKVVDRLLASPRFGEHWARRWMDLTRYAETYGHEFDYPIDNAFQYRDYLIRAFNSDVPYDQFLVEHLAGDRVAQPRKNLEHGFNESLLGTGFWFLGEATHGPVDVKGDEAGRIDNQIDVMGKTFLGLTVACARCHDHKFDAISSKDYYALAGFLQSSRRQVALLDNDQTIERALPALQGHRQAVDENFSAWEKALQNVDRQLLSSNLATAIEFSRNRPANDPVIYIQGESWRETKVDQGTLEVQHLDPTDKVTLEGNEQIWWRDASAGSQLALKFQTEKFGKYELSLKCLKARDYGIAKIWVDNHVDQAKTVDFFARSVREASVDLGTFELPDGEHHLHLEIVGHNDKADPRHMVGIDAFSLKPSAAEQLHKQWQQNLETACRERGQNPKDVTALIEAIGGIPDSGSSLSTLKQAFRLNDPESLTRWKEQLAKPSENSEGTVFEDFPDGYSAGWLATGWAFGPSEQIRAVTNLSVGAVHSVNPADTFSSATNGSGMQGSIRSPTFEINSNQIHYRLRGQNVQIRLIVDGFQLDTFNNLLFNGFSIDIPQLDSWGWVTQSGDIKNYRGHRAYIEINDLGNGWVTLDKVVFSDGPPPTEPSALGLSDLEALKDTTPENVAAALASALSNKLADDRAPTDDHFGAAVLEWIGRNGLEPCFLNSATEIPTTTASVSLVDHSATAVTLRETWQALLSELEKSSQQIPAPTPAIGMTEGTPENEFVFIRGNHKTLGPEAKRQTLAALLPESGKNPFEDITGSGRLELALSMIDPQHPLTSRVMVNRLWYHLFGRGIVGSIDNFGVLGEAPTHPELLDYLASELMADQWSTKRFLKRLVLTHTYQLSSKADALSLEKDPSNLLYHSARIRRLSGEAIRDSILSVSGEMKNELYGPPVPVHLTPFMQGRGRPGSSGPLDGNGRRSVYLEVRRNFLNPMMLAFDTPIPFNSTARRNVSNVPAQSLILMNDPFVVDQATKWANRIVQSSSDNGQRVDEMYFQAIGRRANPTEIQDCLEFLSQSAKEQNIPDAEISANSKLWQDLAHVIFNLKSFTFVY